MRVTRYATPMYVVDFTRALNFVETQPRQRLLRVLRRQPSRAISPALLPLATITSRSRYPSFRVRDFPDLAASWTISSE
jgi:hypothetical protein